MAVLTLTDEQKERIWQGKYWGKDGVLVEVREAYRTSDRSPASSIVMLSTEYSAASRARKDLFRGGVKARFLAPWRFVNSARPAVRLARRLASKVQKPDHIDVVATVLTQSWQRTSARRLLDRIPWYDLIDRQGVAPHTKGFMIQHAIACGLAELSKERIAQIERCAQETERTQEFRQAMRVWRTAYWLKRQLGKREGTLRTLQETCLPELQRRWKRCAEQANSADQQAKF